MVTHLRYAKAGPPQRYMLAGGRVVTHETSVPLAIDGVFDTPLSSVRDSLSDAPVASGDMVARGDANSLTIDILADEASVAEGVVVQEYDIEGVEVGDPVYAEALVANTRLLATIPLSAHSFSLSVTNGASVQTEFSLSAYLHTREVVVP